MHLVILTNHFISFDSKDNDDTCIKSMGDS